MKFFRARLKVLPGGGIIRVKNLIFPFQKYWKHVDKNIKSNVRILKLFKYLLI